MPPQIKAPRGTRDLLPGEAERWNRLEELARDLADRYAFERLEPPLFERVDLFARGLGESSDAVEKEMFLVSGPAESDEARAEWALRPEPTAGIVRAYVEHGMHVRPGPQRFWLMGPMFRYDRPQAGRYREFTQWDVEVIGDPGPMVDAELIELAHRYLAEAGVTGAVAHVNSIGDAACRPRYRELLIEYFTGHEERLSDDSRRRLRVNPLRVLDDKLLDPDLAAGAPRSADHLCEACAEHFAEVCSLLDRLGLAYEVDHRLVRGLDYYTRTTFEFFVAGREGQQQALAGGGRYDGLVELLGGRPTPGIGFGLGIDRVALALDEQGADPALGGPLLVVVSPDPEAFEPRLRVASLLRHAGLRVRADGSTRKLGRQLESAGKLGAAYAVIVGDELARGVVVLRDLARGEQQEVLVGEVPDAVAAAGADTGG